MVTNSPSQSGQDVLSQARRQLRELAHRLVQNIRKTRRLVMTAGTQAEIRLCTDQHYDLIVKLRTARKRHSLLVRRVAPASTILRVAS